MSESPSPAFAPCGIPEDEPPEELVEEVVVGVEDVCDVVLFGLAAEVVLVWLAFDPHPAATRATMRAAPAARRRRDVMGLGFMRAPLKIMYS
ncbi:MAG TPA: hypothetical protein VE983_08350 [Solirubrobacteraceae bacterium]|nr:hypothetical protein [Solirubrobacteraceae bacterium]